MLLFPHLHFSLPLSSSMVLRNSLALNCVGNWEEVLARAQGKLLS